MPLEALSLVLAWRLDCFIVVERWRAILKASDGRNLIRAGFPRSDISFRNVSRLSLPTEGDTVGLGPCVLSSIAYDHDGKG